MEKEFKPELIPEPEEINMILLRHNYNMMNGEMKRLLMRESIGGNAGVVETGEKSYSAAAANSYVDSKTGEINFTPEDNDVGKHKLFILAVNEENCFDGKIISIRVYDKPKIIDYVPLKTFVVTDETKPVLFNASVEDKDNTTIKYKWYFDDILVSSNNSYIFYPNYSSSGHYYVMLKVENR